MHGSLISAFCLSGIAGLLNHVSFVWVRSDSDWTAGKSTESRSAGDWPGPQHCPVSCWAADRCSRRKANRSFILRAWNLTKRCGFYGIIWRKKFSFLNYRCPGLSEFRQIKLFIRKNFGSLGLRDNIINKSVCTDVCLPGLSLVNPTSEVEFAFPAPPLIMSDIEYESHRYQHIYVS